MTDVFKQKAPVSSLETGAFHYAEKEGFEPPDLLQSAVFKTAAIDHSATSLKNEMVKRQISKAWKLLH